MNRCILVAIVLSTAVHAGIATPRTDPVVYIAGFTDAAGSRAWDNVEVAVRDMLIGSVSGYWVGYWVGPA